MTRLTDVGYVTPAGQDVLPTTAPHLDVRVLKSGQYIDPGTIRSLLTRLKVGKERRALWEQKDGSWSPSFAITSPFGARTAPTSGASTNHLGQDYGVPGGSSLAWEGPGSFTPGEGYGTIKTTDPQGTPYEIRLLHTKGGKPSEVASAADPQNQQALAPAGDTYIFVGGKKQNTRDYLTSYIEDMLSGSSVSPVKSIIDPTAMLTAAFNQTPNYLT